MRAEQAPGPVFANTTSACEGWALVLLCCYVEVGMGSRCQQSWGCLCPGLRGWCMRVAGQPSLLLSVDAPARLPCPVLLGGRNLSLVRADQECWEAEVRTSLHTVSGHLALTSRLHRSLPSPSWWPQGRPCLLVQSQATSLGMGLDWKTGLPGSLSFWPSAQLMQKHTSPWGANQPTFFKARRRQAVTATVPGHGPCCARRLTKPASHQGQRFWVR